MGQHVRIELERDRRRRQLEMPNEPWMKLAEPARDLAVEAHFGASSGMQPRARRCNGGDTQRRHERFEIALDVEEVDSARPRSPLLRFCRTQRKPANP